MRGRLLVLLLLLALGAVLAGGCGNGGEAISSTAGGGTDATTTTSAPAAPSGTLRADGVGPVEQGMSKAEVVGLFGPPDQQGSLSGCELRPDSGRSVQMRYDVGDGELLLNFGAADDELVSYQTVSPELETERGDRIGDSFAALRDHWGPSLEPVDLGFGASTPREGTWAVMDSAKSQLSFAIAKGEIRSISGGNLPPCE